MRRHIYILEKSVTPSNIWKMFNIGIYVLIYKAIHIYLHKTHPIQ